MTRKPVTVTLSPSAEDALESRFDRRYGVRDRSTTVSCILDRYDLIVRRCVPDLSEAEWDLIRDSLNGTILWDSPWSVLGLEVGIADSINLDRLDKKWGVDGAALIEKLAALDYAGKVAVVDFAERSWIDSAGADAGD